MRINNLKLTNFRNYESLDLDLLDSSTLFYGSNGQGKTNLLEAIKFASVLKSFREEERKNLIRLGSEQATILIDGENRLGKQILKIVIDENKLNLFINNKRIKQHNEFIGCLNVVSFTPRDVFLFKDPKKVRRDFLDEEISKLSPAYEMAIKDFYKVLKERNELLKNEELDETLLNVLSKRLATLNKEISIKRESFVSEINKGLSKMYKSISGEAQELKLNYINGFVDKSEEEILAMINEHFEEDRRRALTKVGIHHDDLLASIDGKDVASFASQGQQRSAVIALKLTLIELSKETTQETPIVILDDVFSELDVKHQQSLLRHLKGKNQLFISMASVDVDMKDELEKNSKILKIKDGQVLKEEM